MRNDAEGAQRPHGRPAENAEGLRVAGRVVEQLPSALYRVELSSEGKPRVTAHVAGQATEVVRLRPGDAVEVEISAYDPGRARILGRRAD